MTSTMMIIPNTINVGYQKRDDTYTGKLAYVIYTDAKGVLRKEQSWNSWRDAKIKAQTFNNEPTSGFVLNKGVGGVRDSYSSWNPRNEYIRVFDPRGFEFEISVANLLFILQEATSTKGKGLEGDFIYAWDKADLVLLPTGCREFKECSTYTSNQLNKIDKKEMVEGCLYLMKDNTKVMYLGRHNWYQKNYEWKEDHSSHYIKDFGKKHIFIDTADNWACSNPRYITQTGFTKIAERLTTEVSSTYANAYEAFKKGIHGSPTKGVKITKKKITKKDIESLHYCSLLPLLVEEDSNYFMSYLLKHREITDKYRLIKGALFKPEIVDGVCLVPNKRNNYNFNYSREGIVLSEEELREIQFFTASIENAKGVLFNIID